MADWRLDSTRSSDALVRYSQCCGQFISQIISNSSSKRRPRQKLELSTAEASQRKVRHTVNLNILAIQSSFKDKHFSGTKGSEPMRTSALIEEDPNTKTPNISKKLASLVLVNSSTLHLRLLRTSEPSESPTWWILMVSPTRQCARSYSRSSFLWKYGTYQENRW